MTPLPQIPEGHPFEYARTCVDMVACHDVLHAHPTVDVNRIIMHIPVVWAGEIAWTVAVTATCWIAAGLFIKAALQQSLRYDDASCEHINCHHQSAFNECREHIESFLYDLHKGGAISMFFVGAVFLASFVAPQLVPFRPNLAWTGAALGAISFGLNRVQWLSGHGHAFHRPFSKAQQESQGPRPEEAGGGHEEP